MNSPFLSRTRLCILILVGIALEAGAQPAPVQESAITIVSSTGVGTVYTRPTHAVFWLHEVVTAETLELALKSSASLGTAFREFTVEKELRPTLFEISTPAVMDLEGCQVRTSIEVRFSMAPYTAGESGASKFGALCDHLKAFAKASNCELSQPDFVTTEAAAAVQDAVAEATKNAYTAAAGAASALGTTIRSVDAVEVGTLRWNDPPDTEAQFPTIEQLACTAEARITYLLEYP